MPEDIREMKDEDWLRSMLHTNTEIHKIMEDEDLDITRFKYPCCPAWVCKHLPSHLVWNVANTKAIAPPITGVSNVFSNTRDRNRMYIFDSNNGLQYTLMKTIARYDDHDIE